MCGSLASFRRRAKPFWRRLEGLIARARGEEQPLVFVAVPQYPYLAQLTFQMRLESFDGSRRQADVPAATEPSAYLAPVL